MPTIHRTLGSLRALLTAAVVLLALLPGANAAPGDLYIANFGADSQNILRVTPGGVTSTFSVADVDGPVGLAFDKSGNLYVANSVSNSITRYAPDGTSSVFASASTGLSSPFGLAIDAAGNVYVSNARDNFNILRYTPAGDVSVFFNGAGGTTLRAPAGLAFDPAGNLIVANAGLQNIVSITPAGVASVFAPTGSSGLNIPTAVAVDGSGNIYAANNTSGQPGNILRFTPSGQGSVFASSGVNFPSALAFNAAGTLFVGNARDNTISALSTNGTSTPFAVSGLVGPSGLTFQPGSTPPVTTHPAFFGGEASLGSGAYYLAFPNGKPFGYYAYLTDQKYIFHYDLGFEYLFDANDGKSGIYFYDFASSTFFYSSPSLFPYLYDFSLNTFLYYFPRATVSAPNVYTSNPRMFFNFGTGQIITK